MAGWFLAGGTWSGELLWMMIGMSLLYVGGMTLNDAFDAEWDARNAAERPIPAGEIGERSVWVLGWAQMLGGVLVIVGFTKANWYCWLALVLTIVLYNWSHKRWKGAALVMGGCRFLVYFVSASAVLGEEKGIPGELLAFAIGLCVYVTGITIAARNESTSGNVGWFGKGLLFAPLLAGIVTLAMGVEHGLWGILAVALFVLWLIHSLRQLHSTRADRIGRFVGALLAGIIFIDLIVLVQFGVIFWPICGSLLVLTLLAQRWIPAT